MDQFANDQDQFLDAEAAEAAARSGSRDSLMLTAQLRLPGLAKPVQVRVRNLSSGGLMAEYAGPARDGDDIEVEVRGIGWMQGKVAWVTDDRIGIAFNVAIDPKLARKPVSAAAPAKRKHAPL